MKNKKAVFYGLKYENLWEKTKWFLSLTPTQRYSSLVSMQELFFASNPSLKKENESRKSFKTIQFIG